MGSEFFWKNATEIGGDKNVTIILLIIERWHKPLSPLDQKNCLKFKKCSSSLLSVKTFSYIVSCSTPKVLGHRLGHLDPHFLLIRNLRLWKIQWLVQDSLAKGVVLDLSIQRCCFLSVFLWFHLVPSSHPQPVLFMLCHIVSKLHTLCLFWKLLYNSYVRILL